MYYRNYSYYIKIYDIALTYVYNIIKSLIKTQLVYVRILIENLFTTCCVATTEALFCIAATWT